MEIILLAILALFFGVLVCCTIGGVQVRILQTALHANGLGTGAIVAGGSLPDMLFALAGAGLAEVFFSGSAASLQIWKLFVLFLLAGYGLYALWGRKITNRTLGTSTGEVASFTSAFGVGLFNYPHLLFWISTSTLVRHWGLLGSDWTSRLVWGFMALAGVVGGYLFTAKTFKQKSIAVATSASATISKLLGIILLLLSSTLAFSLLA